MSAGRRADGNCSCPDPARHIASAARRPLATHRVRRIAPSARHLGSTKAIEPISNSWRSGATAHRATFETERSILPKGCNGLSGILAEMLQRDVRSPMAAWSCERCRGTRHKPGNWRRRHGTSEAPYDEVAALPTLLDYARHGPLGRASQPLQLRLSEAGPQKTELIGSGSRNVDHPSAAERPAIDDGHDPDSSIVEIAEADASNRRHLWAAIIPLCCGFT